MVAHLKAQVSNAQSEREHWRGEADHWRDQAQASARQITDLTARATATATRPWWRRLAG